ncbi:MAG: LysM peptidoglycan-binding domain-containing protein [Myxococcaceae bacterium]
MKTLFFISLFITSFWITGDAQTNEKQAQAEAVAKYPELGISGSDFNKQFLKEYKSRRATDPSFFTNPRWPIILSEEIATFHRANTGAGVVKNTAPSEAAASGPMVSPSASTDSGAAPQTTSGNVAQRTSTEPSSIRKTYTVVMGDNLTAIAKRMRVDYEEMLRINSIKDPRQLLIGQVLKMPEIQTTQNTNPSSPNITIDHRKHSQDSATGLKNNDSNSKPSNTGEINQELKNIENKSKTIAPGTFIAQNAISIFASIILILFFGFLIKSILNINPELKSGNSISKSESGTDGKNPSAIKIASPDAPPTTSSEEEHESTQRCAFCAEVVLITAKKCKHCGELLNGTIKVHNQSTVTCRTCGQGKLQRIEKHRLSEPVVIIGYILLIPCFAGMLFGSFTLIVSLFIGASGGAAGIVGGVFGAGFSVFISLSSFAGGLLGWLLVMKKTVLQCTHCSSTVAAS